MVTQTGAASAADPAPIPLLYTRFARPQWEITPERAAAWARHCFRKYRGADSLLALINDEWGLLLSDLDCYAGMCRRWGNGTGPMPPAPHLYLMPGREHWGWLSGLIEQVHATAAAPPLGTPPPDLEDRDCAIRELRRLGWPVTAICLLRVGDLDLETGWVHVGQTWELVTEFACYCIESYLDTRPELHPDAPMFVSREGGYLSNRQVRRILGDEE